MVARHDVAKHPLDYRLLFELSPIACAVLDNRITVDCSQSFMDMWRGQRSEIVGSSFAGLYAGATDFDRRGERIGPILAREGHYSDNWLMRRLDGETFWSHVSGTTVDQRTPYARVIWTFVDLSVKPRFVSPERTSLTPREREIATLLLEGCSSKNIARRLDISPRTVHVHRASLLRKYRVGNTRDLCRRLLEL